MSNNPFQSPEQNPMQQPYQQMHGAPDASGKVSGPAIGLMVVAVLNILFSLYGLGSGILMATGVVDTIPAMQAQLDDAIAQMERDGASQDEIDMAKGIFDMQVQYTLPITFVLYSLTLIIGIFILMGALKMKKLKSYGMAMTSSILAMIPCLSWAACCLLGVGLGIWSIVVLNDVHVKNAFGAKK